MYMKKRLKMVFALMLATVLLSCNTLPLFATDSVDALNTTQTEETETPLNMETSEQILDLDDTQQALEPDEYDDIMPLSLGSGLFHMVDKNDGKISTPGAFSLGSPSSTKFTVLLSMSTNEQESFQVTIPAGFTFSAQTPDSYTMSSVLQPNGDMVYTYASKNALADGSFEADVIVDYDQLLQYASETPARTIFDFSVKVISNDGSIITDGEKFTITIPQPSDYSLQQVDTYDGTFAWTPSQLAGNVIDGSDLRAGIHYANQAATKRVGSLQKKLQIEIQKGMGDLVQNNWSLDTHLPLYWKESIIAPQIDLCIDGVWKTMKDYTNAFNPVVFSGDVFDVLSVPSFGFPTNYSEKLYANEQILTLKDNLVTLQNTDTGLGTSKTVYEWLTKASAIRVNYAGDVMWDGAFQNQDTHSQMTVDVLKDNEEEFIAAQNTSLTFGGDTKTTSDPLVIHLNNGLDQTLKVDIATIDKIQMDVSTSKTTVENRGVDSPVRNGYAAVFGTAKNNDYAYFTNLVASFDFPWEYSPVGAIELCPTAGRGNARNDWNPSEFDYTFTISKTGGSTRVISKPHVNYQTPLTYVPDLAADEWVSNITVTAAKVWKNTYTIDSSVLDSTTINHPLFFANCGSKGTYVNGTKHTDGDQVVVKSKISSDQTGPILGNDKIVTLIGDKDNMIIWSESEAANRYPIGYFGNNAMEYIELHAKKYTDTAIYNDPYIELTGEALGLLNKVTYQTNVGTDTEPAYHYLTLRGYQLDDGTWVDVNDSKAASLLNGTEGYYDLSGEIPSGHYLTGLRLAPLDLNGVVVDTTTTPEEIDVYDGEMKHYLEYTYRLYLYDKVWPGYLGYDETLKNTYTNITDLDSSLPFNLAFHCDYLNETHDGTTHIKPGMESEDKQSATLIYGDLPDSLYGRDNDYDVATAPDDVTTAGWRKYYITELTNVAIDDGPANQSTINAWGEMQNATLKFDNTTQDEKRMLALTKGVSLIGSNWQGASYLNPETLTAVVRYKTNKTEADGDQWVTVDKTSFTTKERDDRAVVYFDLSDGEYITALEVDYPEDYLYKAGYSVPGKEDPFMRSQQLPDVGLLTQGTIPRESPIEGDSYVFTNNETLDYHANLVYQDIVGTQKTVSLDYTTARLQPYPTMLVNSFTSSVTYLQEAYPNSTDSVFQAGLLDATLVHTYSFTSDTKNIDSDKEIHPTLCYEIDKNFTVSDTSALAMHLGVNPNQVSLTPKNDGSGNSILKIEYGPQGSQIRDVNFTITIPLTARPNAQTTNVIPIKNSWLTLDYDTTLQVTGSGGEGEYISVNEKSTLLENNPENVLPDTSWTDGTRLALVNPLNLTVNINKFSASSLAFYGTDGSGNGMGQSVTGRDGENVNQFGIGETLYGPEEPSSNWVIYIAVPTTGQQVPYSPNNTAEPSQFTLTPLDEITLDSIAGTTYTTQYYFPTVSGVAMVPSMAGLTLNSSDTPATIMQKDDDSDTGGTWKTWGDMTEAERQRITYVRIIADQIPAGAELSSMLLMRLKTEKGKEKVGEMYAWTSLVYNYLRNDGGMAFPGTDPGNLTATNGKASPLVQYVLSDFKISGQLWHEQKFNNTFTTEDGDVLTKDGMTLALVDSEGQIVKKLDDSKEEITINADGSYYTLVPSKGDYFITLVSTEKDWLPVAYNGSNIQNAMQYQPEIDQRTGAVLPENEATAKVTIVNDDVAYINGGIEKYGSLTVDKQVSGDLSEVNRKFVFYITPNGTTEARTYSGTLTYTEDGVTKTEALNLKGGTDNAVPIGHGDSYTVRLPVGLGYKVNESADGYITTITTKENGILQTGEAAQAVSDKVTSNYVVDISYNEDGGSKGGNEEHYLNNRESPSLTGVKRSIAPYTTLIIVCFLGIVLLGFFQNKTSSERMRNNHKEG